MKQLHIKYSVLVVGLVVGLSITCKQDGFSSFRRPAQADANVPAAVPPPQKTPLQVMQLCLSCHDNPKSGAPPIPFTDKIGVIPWIDSIKDAIDDPNPTMPPDPMPRLSDQDRNTLEHYLDSVTLPVQTN